MKLERGEETTRNWLSYTISLLYQSKWCNQANHYAVKTTKLFLQWSHESWPHENLSGDKYQVMLRELTLWHSCFWMPIQHWSRALYSQAQKIPSAFHIAHDSLLLSTHSVIQSLSVKDFAKVELGEGGRVFGYFPLGKFSLGQHWPNENLQCGSWQSER